MNRLGTIAATFSLLAVGVLLPAPGSAQEKGAQPPHAQMPGDQPGMPPMMRMMQQMSGMMENCNRVMEGHRQQHPTPAPQSEKKG